MTVTEYAPALLARAYNSVWQLRGDAWSSLADATKRLFDTSLPAEQSDTLRSEVAALLQLLDPIETYWAYPGREQLHQLREMCEDDDYEAAMRIADTVSRHLVRHEMAGRPVFEVLIVDDISQDEAQALREELHSLRREEDPFSYELVIVPSFEDALVAVLLNSDLQACVIRPGLAVSSLHRLDDLRHLLQNIGDLGETQSARERMLLLGERIVDCRPEMDLYLVAQVSIEHIAGRLTRHFRRIFHRQDSLELHLSILAGVGERYETPFFTALRGYSRQPTGVFHALPISRGKSIVNSQWSRELTNFYGLNMFLAETSATSGGLDSLLDPTGTIRKAQELAARAFGAQRTFFVTNGTSTANKIVVQSIVAPGDVVLVDRNCHKSHHYGLLLAGARVCYLDAYPLDAYSMYGAVPLESIKDRLLEYQQAGRLHQVKMLSLTNCTFDGIVYDVERVMEECLAIKPDLVFLWDEAWFAFAGFHPVYRRRTAMYAARRLQERYRSAEYVQEYAEAAAGTLPDPEAVRIRVYATQSTHKTLTALRQGSMIHVFDQDFNRRNEEAFHEAYMTHTSTSPNYQIIASLDVGRQQVELEGYQLVQKQTELAMGLYDAVESHPLIQKYFGFLTTREMIPAKYRTSGIELPLRGGLADMERAWECDEFVIDPCRLTLFTGRSGIDGDTFKHAYLMDRYGIQVNKTARNSVLFMTNIGTNRSSVAYLIEVLVNVAAEFDEELARLGPLELQAREQSIAALTSDPPALPSFSYFAESFRGNRDSPDGDLRSAYFLAYDHTACEYLAHAELADRVASGREVVSAMFVTPYPPGFPVLVPGQVVTNDILAFMSALDTREIHGYLPEFGYRVFTETAMRTGREEGPANA